MFGPVLKNVDSFFNFAILLLSFYMIGVCNKCQVSFNAINTDSSETSSKLRICTS